MSGGSSNKSIAKRSGALAAPGPSSFFSGSAMKTITEVKSAFARLPINDANSGVFEALLRLPYDLYRPIIDMLLDGTIVVEDLVPAELAGGGSSYGRARAAAGDSEAAAARAVRWAEDISPSAILANVEAILAGGRPGALAVPRDTSPILTDGAGRPIGVYASPGVSVLSADSQSASPNPIEVARAEEEGTDAGKYAQRALGAALPNELKE